MFLGRIKRFFFFFYYGVFWGNRQRLLDSVVNFKREIRRKSRHFKNDVKNDLTIVFQQPVRIKLFGYGKTDAV